jgi:excisionase family DNA binding protein
VLYPKILPPWYQNMDLMAEGLLDVKEASKFLGIGRSKLYELMASQEIPYVKLGKCLRIPKVVLKIYAEQR